MSDIHYFVTNLSYSGGKYLCRVTFNPLQYSCLEISMDRGAWWATVHRVTKNRHYWSDLACTHTHTHTHTQSRFYLLDILSYLKPGNIFIFVSNYNAVNLDDRI